jgi:SagB-type dehydrogenase family enzyme
MTAPAHGPAGLDLLRRYFRLTLEEMSATVPRAHAHAANITPASQEPLPARDGVGLSRRPALPERADWHAAERAPARPLDDPGLTGLLHFGYGLSALELGPQSAWPYHRHVPSARCLFPAEIHLGTRRGWFRYDPLHHRLLQHEIPASAIWGGCVLVISACFSRTAARYGDYAYRLICQEAGLLAGNLVLVARGLGLAADTIPFLDPASYDRLLGLVPGWESVLAAVAVTEKGAPPPAALVRSWPGDGQAVPARPSPAASLIGRVHDVFRLGLASGAAPGRRARPDGGGDCAAGCVPVPDAPRSQPLGRALRARQSGDPGFRPSAAGIPFPVLGDILARADPAGPTQSALPEVRIAVAARSVPGLAAGVHEYRPACRGLHPIKGGEPADLVASTEMAPVVNARYCPAVLWILTDREQWLTATGPAAFVQSHVTAGAITQRCCVAAAAHGLVARIHNGYQTESVLHAVASADPVAPLFQIMLTWPRATARYRLPIGLP